jgi:predicted metal-dependent HD superfamily phosphohydrolase
MDYQNITERAREFVTAYMRGHERGELLYHNLAHTESVVAATREIARHSHLSQRELFITTVAAWFGDIGYYGDGLHPTVAAASMAEEFLKGAGVNGNTGKEVAGCLQAATLTREPSSLAEQVATDAAFFYLGNDDFSERTRLLRKEWEAVHDTSITKEEWCRRTVQLMEAHHYYTTYCQRLLNKKKKQHTEKLKKKLKEAPLVVNGSTPQLADEEFAHPSHTTETALRVEKGTETLFRVTSGVSQRLSEQADNKANILISVNSIIMSILLSIVVARLDRYPHLTIPIMLFLGVNLFTITYSVLATRPSVPNGVFNHQDVDSRKVNLLFFGNFYRMNFEEYSTGMMKVLGDKQYLYLSFIRNLYEHGVVLGRKYRKLKVAYNVFMYGIIVSVVAFVIATEFFADSK